MKQKPLVFPVALSRTMLMLTSSPYLKQVSLLIVVTLFDTSDFENIFGPLTQEVIKDNYKRFLITENTYCENTHTTSPSVSP